MPACFSLVAVNPQNAGADVSAVLHNRNRADCGPLSQSSESNFVFMTVTRLVDHRKATGYQRVVGMEAWNWLPRDAGALNTKFSMVLCGAGSWI